MYPLASGLSSGAGEGERTVRSAGSGRELCFARRIAPRRATALRWGIPVLLLAGAGCNGNFAMRPGDLVRLPPVDSIRPPPRDVRDWLARAHAVLARELPPLSRPALLTDDLATRDGRPVNVWARFWIVPAALKTLLLNLPGYIDTVLGSASTFAVEDEPPPWPGFDTVWIPVQNGIELCGRLGLARDERGAVRDTACVIILPGFFGDHSVVRTRDLAAAIRGAGLHALSLEMRGHGQVERRYPDRGYTFGVIETGDLLYVDEWLRRQAGVHSTGVVGFCWGGNVALLAAWLDGRTAEDENVGPTLAGFVPPPSGERHFAAGVLAFSPVLHFEDVIEDCDTWRSPAWDPPSYALQNVVRWRILLKGWGRPHYSLRRLIDREFANSELGIDEPRWRDSLRFLRLMPFRGRPAGAKLSGARCPVLLVHGANDPFIPAQLVADCVSGIRNRNVAAVILPGGGHIGFAPYARRYFYSLIINFFDPDRGPAGLVQSPAP